MSFDIPEMTECRIVYSRRPTHTVSAGPFTCMTMYQHLFTLKINSFAVKQPYRCDMRYMKSSESKHRAREDVLFHLPSDT